MDTTNVSCPVLQALCLLNNTLNQHLESGEFSDTSLNDALPDSFKLTIKDADTYIPIETANPVITCKRGAIQTAPVTAKGNDKSSIQVVLNTSMTYTVSTISKPLTESICMELTGYLWSISRALHSKSCFVKGVSISEVQHDHKGHADYYICTVQLSVESGIWWKRDIPTTILKEIGVSVSDT